MAQPGRGDPVPPGGFEAVVVASEACGVDHSGRGKAAAEDECVQQGANDDANEDEDQNEEDLTLLMSEPSEQYQ